MNDKSDHTSPVASLRHPNPETPAWPAVEPPATCGPKDPLLALAEQVTASLVDTAHYVDSIRIKNAEELGTSLAEFRELQPVMELEIKVVKEIEKYMKTQIQLRQR